MLNFHMLILFFTHGFHNDWFRLPHLLSKMSLHFCKLENGPSGVPCVKDRLSEQQKSVPHAFCVMTSGIKESANDCKWICANDCK